MKIELMKKTYMRVIKEQYPRMEETHLELNRDHIGYNHLLH